MERLCRLVGLLICLGELDQGLEEFGISNAFKRPWEVIWISLLAAGVSYDLKVSQTIRNQLLLIP